MIEDNNSLAKFHFDGIPLTPRDLSQVEVTFDIDVNGILNIPAQDKSTGKTNQVPISLRRDFCLMLGEAR